MINPNIFNPAKILDASGNKDYEGIKKVLRIFPQYVDFGPGTTPILCLDCSTHSAPRSLYVATPVDETMESNLNINMPQVRSTIDDKDISTLIELIKNTPVDRPDRVSLAETLVLLTRGKFSNL